MNTYFSLIIDRINYTTNNKKCFISGYNILDNPYVASFDETPSQEIQILDKLTNTLYLGNHYSIYGLLGISYKLRIYKKACAILIMKNHYDIIAECTSYISMLHDGN